MVRIGKSIEDPSMLLDRLAKTLQHGLLYIYIYMSELVHRRLFAVGVEWMKPCKRAKVSAGIQQAQESLARESEARFMEEVHFSLHISLISFPAFFCCFSVLLSFHFHDIFDHSFKPFHQGLLRQVPLVSSVLDWLSPPQRHPARPGRAFDLTSGSWRSMQLYTYVYKCVWLCARVFYRKIACVHECAPSVGEGIVDFCNFNLWLALTQFIFNTGTIMETCTENTE